MPLLDVRGLVKWYGPRKVVDGVSFHVNAGEVVGLLGPNGAGKTTSFRMTTGQVPPNDGQVFFADADVTHQPMFRRARLGMGYLSQEPSIFRKLTVEKNLIAILEALPRSRTLGRKLTSRERWERTDAALARFKLDAVRHNPAARCSGGEKRRLEIARCLVCEPLLILLDEPFAAVDPITKEDLRTNIRMLADQGIGILLTDHDVREVLKITDRSYLIQEGRVVCHGTPEEIKRDPIAVKGYLGSTFAEELNAELSVIRNAPPAPNYARPAPPPAVSALAEHAEPIILQLPANEKPEPEPPKPQGGLPTPEKPPAKAPPTLASGAPSTSAVRDELAILTLPPLPPLPPPKPAPPQPSAAGAFSGTTQRLLEQEKLRRLVDQFADRTRMAAAIQEIVNHGANAIPALIDGLERREVEIRHVAHRLLEQLLGESFAYDAAAPDDVRLRQAAFIRARIEKRKSA
jgi:lipopolysaccharide export system ATP-binding protein